MPWLQERITHHGTAGKFCSPGSAVTVTKDGERYKIVRQHRRMKPKTAATLEALNVAREKRDAAIARSSMRGFIPVASIVEVSKSRRPKEI